MQTLSVQIQDSYIQQFMNFVNNSHSKVTIKKDKNLEYDPCFYERKQQLQKDMDDIDSGEIKMINNEDFWDEIDSFTESLQK
jgi:hypothetical protein